MVVILILVLLLLKLIEQIKNTSYKYKQTKHVLKLILLQMQIK